MRWWVAGPAGDDAVKNEAHQAGNLQKIKFEIGRHMHEGMPLVSFITKVLWMTRPSRTYDISSVDAVDGEVLVAMACVDVVHLNGNVRMLQTASIPWQVIFRLTILPTKSFSPSEEEAKSSNFLAMEMVEMSSRMARSQLLPGVKPPTSPRLLAKLKTSPILLAWDVR